MKNKIIYTAKDIPEDGGYPEKERDFFELKSKTREWSLEKDDTSAPRFKVLDFNNKKDRIDYILTKINRGILSCNIAAKYIEQYIPKNDSKGKELINKLINISFEASEYFKSKVF